MTPGLDDFFAHHWLALCVGYFIFSNFVSSMPTPNGSGPTASWLYKWAFGFLHLCAGNAARIAATMGPRALTPGAAANPPQKS